MHVLAKKGPIIIKEYTFESNFDFLISTKDEPLSKVYPFLKESKETKHTIIKRNLEIFSRLLIRKK